MKAIAFAVAPLLLVSIAAAAQQPVSGSAHVQMLFRNVDTNNDQIITRAEAMAGAATEFASLDTNSDGAVDRAELTQTQMEEGLSRLPADVANQIINQSMLTYDGNHDGRITSEEFQKAATDMLFSGADLNRDGEVTLAEARAFFDSPSPQK